MWIEKATAKIANCMSGNKETQPYFKLIRHALSTYIEIKVKPFFKISGAVAIDETLIGR